MKGGFWTAGALALVMMAVLGAANLLLGNLNQDEGWYLYAGGQLAAGRLPYLDYAFTQGPVFPLAYAAGWPLVEHFGLAGGRLLTFLFGSLAALCAAGLAARMSSPGRRAAAFVITLALVGVNAYQSYYTTIVKTYALCAFFLAAGFLVFSFAAERRRWAAAFLAGILLALAAGTRITAGVALPIAGLLLLWRGRTLGWGNVVSFAAGGGLALAGIFLPFFLLAPDGFVFGLLQYHTLRTPAGAVAALILKAGFISRFVQYYFLPCLLALLLVFVRRRPGATPDAPQLPVACLWVVFAAVTLVQLTANFPYEDYQVIVVPLMAAAIGTQLVRVAAERWGEGKPHLLAGLAWLILLASVAAAFSSPVNQDWFIRGRDRIWWKFKDQPDLFKLQAAGRQLRDMTKPGDLILTQDTYLAIEARRQLPVGLGMGPFSYFPDWDRATALRRHVVNRELMLELIRSGRASAAAISGYGLSIRSPEIVELSTAEQAELQAALLERYAPCAEIPNFGQAFTTLKLYKRKAP